MRRGRENRLAGLWTLLVPALLLGGAWVLARGAETLAGDRSGEAKARLEDALRRSCAACYAAEGRYPQSLDELKDRYGLQLDEEHYAVFYEPFGPNLMPNFTVLECQP